MRASQLLISTLKEAPSDAEVISHQLLVRAGMIRKLASGLYNWLPLGLRVLRNVEAVVRHEINRAGGQELLMPMVQPSELWQQSGRWSVYGPELLRIQDRHQRDFCLGPTHEEIITHIVRTELKSYKQLPVNFYQIQTKFRDEIRPRFGLMRSREFLMMDAYSFHTRQDCLARTYQAMYRAYERIFTRLGLRFCAVEADSGAMGGDCSHEFQVLADTGEDQIVVSDGSDYAANMEKAVSLPSQQARPAPSQPLKQVATPGQTQVNQVAANLGVSPQQLVKTLIVQGKPTTEGSGQIPLVALVLRGDHSLNSVKAEKLPGVASPLTFATEQQIQAAVGCSPGYLGPVNLALPAFVDQQAAQLADFVCGANRDDQHFSGVNWQRDAPLTKVVDIRNVVAGDPSPDGKGHLVIKKGIEVGHIFQQGKKYTQSMRASVLAEDGKPVDLLMCAYGIGVSRIVAAAIEQHHDVQGICWPQAMAPFQWVLIPLNGHKSPKVQQTAETLYQQLQQQGYEVLLEDRLERPGVKFSDMDLIGIPHRLVISERSLAAGKVEYKNRRETASQDLLLNDQLLIKLKQLADQPA